MANQILTPTQITREAARILYNNLAFTKGVNRNYDDTFMLGGAKVGTTINMRLPARYLGTIGSALATEDQTETSRALTLNTQFHVDVTFTTVELTMQLQDFSERVLQPAIAEIANHIDTDGLMMAKNNTFNAVGTPGTTPNALLTYATAGAYMSQEGTPRDGLRTMILEPLGMATIVDTLKGLFQQSDQIGEQYMQGLMGRALGFKWAEDQNVAVQVVGPQGGTPLVAGASQGLLVGWAPYTDLLTNGWSAAAAVRLNRGDIITIAGVFAVNPRNRQSVGRLRQFVVASQTEGAISSDASGNATIRVRPAIIAGGQFQNVTLQPANGAAITVLGAANAQGPRNIAYHRDSFVLGMADLEIPEGVHFAARVSDKQLGISIRMVRQYTINNDSIPARFDVLYGWAPLIPEMACAICG